MTDIIMAAPVAANTASPAASKARRARRAAVAESSASGAAAAAAATVPATSTPVKSKTVHSLRVAASEKPALAMTPAKKRRERSSKRHAGEGSSSKAKASSSSAAPNKVKRSSKPAKSQRAAGLYDRDPESRLWNSVSVAQGSVSTLPVVWSRDGQFYFTALDSTLQIRSATKPAFPLLSTLTSHSQAITSFHLHPTEPYQIVTSSLDGTVKIWDWLDGKLLRTIVFCTRGPVEKCCVGVDGDGVGWIYAAIKGFRTKKDGATRGDIYNHILMVPANTRGTLSEPVRLGKTTNSCTDIFISPLASYLVVLAGFKAHVFRLGRIEPESLKRSQGRKFEYKVKNHAKRSGSAPPTPSEPAVMDKGSFRFLSSDKLTCGAFCPVDKAGLGGLGGDAEEWFATGDEKGVVRLWFGLTEAFAKIDAAKAQSSNALNNTVAPFSNLEKRLPTTTLHWHAHAVAAISFNALGTQLLSVGEESVLVLWHLASGQKEFVPRLGGSGALSVAVKPGKAGVEEEYWVGMRDGSLMRVGASSNNVSTVGKGIALDTARLDTARAYPLAVHPKTKAIVLPATHPSTLQFIDPSTQTVLFHLEVAPSNRVSRRDDKPIEPVTVESVVFDSTGSWMATYESRDGDDAEGGGRVRAVKIWQWEGQAYKLNTHLPRPHAWDKVSSMSFTTSNAAEGSSTASSLFMTAAEAGEVKLWQLKRVNRVLEVSARRKDLGKGKQSSVVSESFWAARSTFNYRSQPVVSATFSHDNTLIALAHPGVVSLWDAATNVLLKLLPAVDLASMAKVAFVGTEGRWLVACGPKRGLVVWDLLSCEITWSLPQRSVRHLIPHPVLPLFLVSAEAPTSKRAQASKFEVFDPASPIALRTRTLNWTARELAFIPSSTQSHDVEVVAVAPGGDLWRLGDALPAGGSTKGSAEKLVVQVTGQESIWREMFGEDAFEATQQQPAPTAAAAATEKHAKVGKAVDVYAGASHTMPPVSLLFDTFIDELLRPKTGASLAASEQPQADEDEPEAILVDEKPMTDVGVLPSVPLQETERDVEDLTGFFKDLFAQPRDVPKPAARAPKATPQRPTPTKKQQPVISSPADGPTTAEEAGDDGEVGKKRKRNRK